MRAIGTSAGTVASSSSRRRRPTATGSGAGAADRARLPGGGLATIATSMRMRSNSSPWSTRWCSGIACAKRDASGRARRRRSCRRAADSSAQRRCSRPRSACSHAWPRAPARDRRRSADVRSACTEPSLRRTAKPNQTVPTGLPALPPPGPAMPVTATARSAAARALRRRRPSRAPPASLTAPCAAISAGGTPSSSILASLL